MMRAVLATALMILGLVALGRTTPRWLDRSSFPGVTVYLSLHEAGDLEEVTRRWLVPLEAEMRSIGGVRHVQGWVWTRGAWIDVELERGTHVEHKVARLSSEVEELRRRLGESGSIDVQPARGGDDDLVCTLWVWAGADVADDVAKRIGNLDGVREVTHYGGAEERIRLQLRDMLASHEDVDRLRETVDDALRTTHLGTVGRFGREVQLVTAGQAIETIGRLPVGGPAGVRAVDDVARVIEEPSVRERRARVDGREGVLLEVHRYAEASIVSVSDRVHESLGASAGARVIHDAARPLRTLIFRWIAGSILATVVLTLAGGWVAGAGGALRLLPAVPLIAASVINATWLLGIAPDLLTLLAGSIAMATALPLAAVRVLRGSSVGLPTLVFAGAVPAVAIHAAGAVVTPMLMAPAHMFFVGLVAAGGAILLLAPAPGWTRVPRRTRGLGFGFRDPATVALGAASIVFGAVALCGAHLRLSNSATIHPGRFTLELELPEGATLLETAERLTRVEEQLDGLAGIRSYRSKFEAGSAQIQLDLEARARRPGSSERLRTRLLYTFPPGTVTVREGWQSGIAGAGGWFRPDPGSSVPELGPGASTYTMILRATDLASVLQAEGRIAERLRRIGVDNLLSGWPSRRPRLEIEPRSVELDAARVVDRSPPRFFRIAGPRQRSWAVESFGTPHEPPFLASLASTPIPSPAGPLSLATLGRLHETTVGRAAMREAGRFVLPLRALVPGIGEEVKLRKVEEIARALSGLALPEAVALERPTLERRRWRIEQWRMLGIALSVPCLLLALAAICLDRPGLAILTQGPWVLGLAAVLPLLAGGSRSVDELAVAAIAPALSGVTIVALKVGARFVASGHAAFYRSMRRDAPAWWAGGAAAVTLLGSLAVAADWSLDPWARPAVLAALVGVVGLTAATIGLPPLLVGLAGRRRRVEARPRVWGEPGSPTLELARVSKIFKGRVHALRDVSVTIEPGITGLLGPNGAGKTTLIRLVTGLLEPTRGRVLYRGIPLDPRNVGAYRRFIGFLPQDFTTHATVTVEEFLDAWALERDLGSRIERARRIGEVLERVDLAEHAPRKVRDLSGGMRRRVGIALALLPSPRVLIVDEPTTGLDLESRERFRQTLVRLAGERVVLFSTHLASDVEAIAQRVLVLHRGRLCFDGCPGELIRRAVGRVFEVVLPDDQLREFTGRYRVTARVRTAEGVRVRAIAGPGQPVVGTPVPPRLEEAYLVETGDTDSGPGGAVRLGFLDRGTLGFR